MPPSSRVKHLQSPQKPRAGNASRPQDIVSESRTPDTGARRRGKMGLVPAQVDVDAAPEYVFRPSVRAASRIEVSRTETDTPSRGESYRGSQRTQSEALAEKTDDKISSETAQELQRAGSAPKRARRHEFVNCASPAVSSFARSGRKLVETGRRNFPERLRCVVVSFLITTAPGSADLAQNPVRKGRPVKGARNREFVRNGITGTWFVRPAVLYFLGRRLQGPWTLTPRGRVGYLQRDCHAQLYCIPRQTRAGILDAQFGSKAYWGVQNHIFGAERLGRRSQSAT